MESALYNSGSAADPMNCPKCGYAQEKRLDCIKCGIVFSKYYAMYPSSKFADAIPAEASTGQELTDQDLRTMLSGLQTQVQVLSNRFAEVEFEKAERNQLRMDLRNLERQLFENLGRLENRIENPLMPRDQEETLAPSLVEIHERLGQMENKLGSLDFAGQYIVELSEKNENNSRHISELQQQLSVLHEEVGRLKCHLEIVAEIQKVEEPRTPLEADVHVIRQTLDELRTYLNKPTAS